MHIHCYNSQDALSIASKQVEKLVQLVLFFKQVSTDEVSLYFVDKATISQMHEEFFQDPSPTDCISFPLDSPDETSKGFHILGEVFVCPAVAIEYAEAHHLSPYEELSLYIVHGLLHLMGYDDLSPEEEKIMRDEEKKCMKYLRDQEALIHETQKS